MRPSPTFESAVSPAAGPRESDVCRSLSGARFEVTDVADGALVIMRPTLQTDIYALHDGSKDLERALGRPDRLIAPNDARRGCGLREIANHHPSAIVERTSAGVRVRVSTADPTQVEALRGDVRRFFAGLQ